ncbi:MAG: TonB-dependent receptor, partial [Bacteroidota bacterium]
DRVKPTAIRNAEFNLGGPLIGEDLAFSINGRYIYFDGWLNGIRRFNPSNIAFTDSTGKFNISRDPSGKGNGSIVPMNWSERKYGQGKLTWRIASLLKLNYNFIYDDNTAKAYSRDYFLNPDGIGKNFARSTTQIAQLTHTLSQNTFYTLGASLFDKDVKYYLYEDPQDPSYIHPKLLTRDDPFSFLTGGTDLNRFHRSTKTMLAKLDLSSQIDNQNLVKIGVEARQHKVFLESFTLQPIQQQSDINLSKDNPFIKTEIPDISSNNHNVYEHKPLELSAYIQDKMEFKDIILNLGIRFDYFKPDGVVLVDESDPSIYNPIKPSNRFNDRNGNGVQDPGEPTKTVEERRAYWYEKARAKYKFSPRIGAAFPITDRGVVHFSYGHFFQIPRFERLYENPDFKLGFGTGNQGLVGNADLEPEQTINGELGIQQQLTDDIVVDLTAYIRDIRNLTGTRADEIVIFGGSAKYSKYVNSDFGFVKGIIFSLDKRFSNRFSARLDYTYQVARGSASDPQQSRNAIAGGALPEIQLTPLDWDQRHTLNVTASYSAPHWGVSFIGRYGTGTPYTPRRSTDITALLTNGQTKPQFLNIDGRAFYEFTIDRLKIIWYVRAFNILDRKNEVGVFDDTGRATFTTDEARTLLLNPAQRVNSIDDFYRIPVFYSEPRRIEFGLNLEF